MSDTQAREEFRRLKIGDTLVENDPRSGNLATTKASEHMRRVQI